MGPANGRRGEDYEEKLREANPSRGRNPPGGTRRIPFLPPFHEAPLNLLRRTCPNE
jgi:hypothetical protein